MEDIITILVHYLFQKKVIQNLCPVTVAGYSGEDGVDYWNKEKWDEELSKNQVKSIYLHIKAAFTSEPIYLVTKHF